MANRREGSTDGTPTVEVVVCIFVVAMSFTIWSKVSTHSSLGKLFRELSVCGENRQDGETKLGFVSF